MKLVFDVYWTPGSDPVFILLHCVTDAVLIGGPALIRGNTVAGYS